MSDYQTTLGVVRVVLSFLFVSFILLYYCCGNLEKKYI